MWSANTRASHGSWKTSSPPGALTWPKPCIPPMSCISPTSGLAYSKDRERMSDRPAHHLQTGDPRGAGSGRALEARRAIVTGAGRGIGAAAARRFCEQGAHVMVADQDGIAAAELAAELENAGYLAHARTVDVTDEVSTRRVVDEAAELLGGLDV